MLTIRMQRTGRKGLANFRVVVQDSRFSPSSGRVVAQLGHYNPHTKEIVLDKEAATKYMDNGAQPSPRVVSLLVAEKVKIPSWVAKADKTKKKETRNPEKLRKNQPDKPVVHESKEPEASTDTAPPAAEEQPVDSETPKVEESPAEETAVPEAAVEEVKAEVSAEPEAGPTDTDNSDETTEPEKPAEA